VDKLPKRFGRIAREEVIHDMIVSERVAYVKDDKPGPGRKSERLFWKGLMAA
jgi:hypothetical protein